MDIELGAVQERFADIVWANEPIASGDLVRVCERELNWKKPTTYTVLRKLCEKGLLRNENGVVTSRISRDEFYSSKSEQIVEESFHGSLPAFIAAFISRKDLSAEEVSEIRKMIDAYKKEG
jgi:predicted transcriptional regulator